MERVNRSSLVSFDRAVLESIGVPSANAESIAESLVDADVAGHSSHGSIRLPWYLGHYEEGALDPTADPETEDLGGPLARVVGEGTFGQLAAREASREVAERAAEHGIAAVGIRSSGHLGRIGEAAERVADADLLFGALVNLQGGAQRVAPPGGFARRLATNPIALAVPSFGALPFPLVLDIATTQVAHGKIKELEGSGKTLPEAWTVTESGEPLREPAAFERGEGALRPIGGEPTGHKGWGLSVMAELWAAALGDAEVSTEPEQGWIGSAAAFFAIDPTAFSAEEDLRERIEDLVAYLREADRPFETGTSADDEALLPGEAEYRHAEECRERGVPIHDVAEERLRNLAIDRGLEDELPPELRA